MAATKSKAKAAAPAKRKRGSSIRLSAACRKKLGALAKKLGRNPEANGCKVSVRNRKEGQVTNEDAIRWLLSVAPEVSK